MIFCTNLVAVIINVNLEYQVLKNTKKNNSLWLVEEKVFCGVVPQHMSLLFPEYFSEKCVSDLNLILQAFK